MDWRERRLRAPSKEMIAVARNLRRRATSAESVLWEALRDRRLGNIKFRRQHALMGMVLDFYCPRAHLAIEVDGGVHDDEEQAKSDAARTELLGELGITVLRLQNAMVLDHLPCALQRILEASSHPAKQAPPLPIADERGGWGVRARGDD